MKYNAKIAHLKEAVAMLERALDKSVDDDNNEKIVNLLVQIDRTTVLIEELTNRATLDNQGQEFK